MVFVFISCRVLCALWFTPTWTVAPVLHAVSRLVCEACLIASIVASVVFWYLSEAFGMILTGMATDFNSGLLVVVMALACWPKVEVLRAARAGCRRSATDRRVRDSASHYARLPCLIRLLSM